MCVVEEKKKKTMVVSCSFGNSLRAVRGPPLGFFLFIYIYLFHLFILFFLFGYFLFCFSLTFYIISCRYSEKDFNENFLLFFKKMNFRPLFFICFYFICACAFGRLVHERVGGRN